MERVVALSFVKENVRLLLSRWGVASEQLQRFSVVTHVVLSIAVALVVLIAARLLMRFVFVPLIKRSKTRFDDILISSRILRWMARIFPILILYVMLPAAFDPESWWFTLCKNVLSIALLIPVTAAALSFFNALNEIYDKQSFAKQRPIKGYVQVVKVVIIGVAMFLAGGVLFDASLLGILGGVGALSAVALLVFKDPVLALMASTQLTLNDMVRIGDWLEIPGHSANGEVIDINLQSIRIQNWDKTIVSVPLYDLISKSFINWRGMEDSGGRRIKRGLNIDMNSVKFCTPQMIERFKHYALLRDYILAKEKEITESNALRAASGVDDVLSNRAMTNLGTFRAYAYAYLQNHPHISRKLTCMVRQLPPTAEGIPVECYCFSAEQDWTVYESIQSDIFDHLISVMSIFELRIFQSLSGHDIGRVGNHDGQATPPSA